MRIIKLFLGCEKVPFLSSHRHAQGLFCMCDVTYRVMEMMRWASHIWIHNRPTGITFNFYLLFPACKPNFNNPKYFTVLTKPWSFLVPKLNLWAKVKQYLTVCCENTVRLSSLSQINLFFVISHSNRQVCVCITVTLRGAGDVCSSFFFCINMSADEWVTSGDAWIKRIHWCASTSKLSSF